MNNDDISDYDMGFNSPIWMLKTLVMHADEKLLRYGVGEMINYMCYSREPETSKALDVLAQIASNGYYTPLREHVCDEGNEHAHVNPAMDPTTRHLFQKPESSLGEEERDRLIREFNDMLNGVPTYDEEENNE